MAHGGPALPQEPASVHDVVRDYAHQRREWVVERVGWVLIALLLLAALGGLLGPGPASRARAETPGRDLRVDYSRIERHHAPAKLVVVVRRPGSDTLRLWLGREFLDRVVLQRVDPVPAGVAAGAAGQVFTFALDAPVPRLLEIVYRYEPAVIGRLPIRLGLGRPGGPSLEVHQFSLP